MNADLSVLAQPLQYRVTSPRGGRATGGAGAPARARTRARASPRLPSHAARRPGCLRAALRQRRPRLLARARPPAAAGRPRALAPLPPRPAAALQPVPGSRLQSGPRGPGASPVRSPVPRARLLRDPRNPRAAAGARGASARRVRAAALLQVFSTTWLVYESWLFYTLPTAVLMTWAAVWLARAARGHTRAVLAYAAAVAGLSWIRATYQPAFAGAALALLLVAVHGLGRSCAGSHAAPRLPRSRSFFCCRRRTTCCSARSRAARGSA